MKAKHRLFTIIACAAILLFCGTLKADMNFGPSVPVQGQIMSRTQGPVPGVTAFLVHPMIGRSEPSLTNAYGMFGWRAIPIQPAPYFLEVYWGNTLIYRQPIEITAPVQLPPILL
jgi:hypothetical protein